MGPILGYCTNKLLVFRNLIAKGLNTSVIVEWIWTVSLNHVAFTPLKVFSTRVFLNDLGCGRNDNTHGGTNRFPIVGTHNVFQLLRYPRYAEGGRHYRCTNSKIINCSAEGSQDRAR